MDLRNWDSGWDAHLRGEAFAAWETDEWKQGWTAREAFVKVYPNCRNTAANYRSM